VVTDEYTGEILCSSCGLVLVEKIPVSGPDQQTFTSEEYFAKSRTGAKTTLALNDMGLSTIIGKTNRDALGHSLSGEMKQAYDRLRMWDNRSKSGNVEARMRSAFTLLDTVRTKLVLPDPIIEEAAYLYRKAKTKKIRGRRIDCMTLASLYLSCRQSSTPRTIPDIASAGNVSIRDLSRHVRLLIADLDLKIESYDSSFFINRIASTVGTSEKSRRNALAILTKTKESGYADGKNPIALAAAALYISSVNNDEKFTQKQIAEASGISTVTLRMRSESLTKTFSLRNILN
jgi:transcription initiation factor TFIIB